MDRIHLENLIAEGYTHKHYQRVTELAELYKAHITGEGLSELLQKTLYESVPMFEQRKEITKHINPSVINQVITVFNRIFRTDQHFSIEQNEEKLTEVFEALETYTGGGNLNHYLQACLVVYMFCDPNAWILNTFQDFDSSIEKAKPFPLIIPSANVIDYSFNNETLQYIVTKYESKYKSGKGEKDGHEYVMFLPDISIKFTQVEKGTQLEGGEVVEIKKKFYLVEEFEHTSKVVPLEILGYEKDIVTNQETYVSPIHSGMPYLEKLLKVVSELDLTMALDAFPQKTTYVDTCKFKQDNTCSTSGQLKENCKICGGTGAPSVSTVQEAIYLKMPKDPQDMLDLGKLTHYNYPPIEIIKFQDEYVDKTAEKFNRAIFNSDTFTKLEVSQTATGQNIDMQAVYDTLHPFAKKISSIVRMIALSTAYYLDYENAKVVHNFPKDFKLKSFNDLMADLQAAMNSGAGAYTISAIQMDIIDCIYADDPKMRKAIRTKHKFNPFSGKTEQEVANIINSNAARQIDVLTYTYLDQIFIELEQENPELYEFTYERIKELVNAKALEFRQEAPTF